MSYRGSNFSFTTYRQGIMGNNTMVAVLDVIRTKGAEHEYGVTLGTILTEVKSAEFDHTKYGIGSLNWLFREFCIASKIPRGCGLTYYKLGCFYDEGRYMTYSGTLVLERFNGG